MAHFAKIENEIVTSVIVVHDNELLVDGVENETIGIEFCQKLFGGNWVQTSYNGTFRKNYAGIGYAYDPQRDAFIAPRPEGDVDFDEETCRWIPKENP